MAFLKDFLNIRDIKGPEFYKDFEAENKQLYDLEELYSRVKSDKRDIIKRDINNLKIGLEGERAVSYELKNSFIPMICLHDIRIENAGYVAQMDYILITKSFIMVLETKKLNGDIVINEAGEFIRRYKTKDGRVYKQEGMYSPIAQNERHVRILENYLKGNGIIKNIPIYSAVVIANPKGIINRSKAPKDIKNGIFKYDQITNMINDYLKRCKNDGEIFEGKMIKIANFLMESNSEITYDYNGKYGLTEEDFGIVLEEGVEPIEEEKAPVVEDGVIPCEEKQDSSVGLYDELKKFRSSRAFDEKVKAYFIFNNATLDELVSI
ncbi:MAG: NERD domain-containing protein, partial [Clostridium sp.]